MMKLIPTIQGLTPSPQLQSSIPYAQPQANPGYQASLAASPFDDGVKKGAGIFGNKSAGEPNIFGGQGPADITPGAQRSVGVPASPQDLAMMRSDQPLTPEHANQIYDAYQRAGGGTDVSGNQFVKNSQFGAFSPQAMGEADMSTSGVGKRPRLDGSTNPLFQTPGMDQISKMLMMGGPGPAVPNG